MNDESLKIAKKIEKLKREFSMLPPLTERHNSLEIEEYQHYLLEMEELIIVFQYLSKQNKAKVEVSEEIPENEAVVEELKEAEQVQESGSEEEIVADVEETVTNEEEIVNEIQPAEETTEDQLEENKIEEKEDEVERILPPEMIETGSSLNDQINANDESLATKLARQPISDLRNAFGLNERFLYANELFGGDGQEFTRALNELNHLESFEDAKRMIEARYENNFGWNNDDENVIAFVDVVERRYL